MPTPRPRPRPPRARARARALGLGLGLALLAPLSLLTLGCPSAAPQWPEDAGFDDHTRPKVADLGAFETLARTGESGTAALKFVILGFEGRAPELRVLDGRFYQYHDEWYWFRLVNGEAVPGSRERPLSGESFATPAEVVAWVEGQDRGRDRPVPLGMKMLDGRLYSSHFYDLAVHREHRAFGIGTLVHMPARTGEHPRPELWAFELEYADDLDLDALERFFASLRAGLPAAIADELVFIARSPAQTQLVARVGASAHPLADRVTTYAALAVPGEVEVYNPGIIAGRLRKLPADPEAAASLLTTGDPRAIWMLPAIPDELPPAAGLLTAVPQTPLAHVNLLARNRGIPNAYLGGLFDDPHLDQLSRIHAPVVVLAEADGTLRIEAITDGAYSRYLGLSRKRRPILAALDPSSLPYTIDLESQDLRAVPDLRLAVGGKAAGYPILHAAGATMPAGSLAVTTRAYAEHLDPLRPGIAMALGDPEFVGDARVRYLLLEGREDFDARFARAQDQRFIDAFVAKHPASKTRDALAQLLAAGGIKRAIRDQPLAPGAAAAIDDGLRAHYGHLAPSQGLRFRSSSTIEDVEGFSGAGLYASYTGFLDAQAQAEAKDRTKDVAWALRKTWASYWGWEAFEERRLSGIDHLAGAMAVLVHPRFDDDLERQNGVITFTLDLGDTRPGANQRGPADVAVMEVNTQLGALSVTNPPPERAGEVLPEVVRVRLGTLDGAAQIERLSRSSESPDADLLDDATLDGLMRQIAAIAGAWLEVENLALAPEAARTRVTLDLEFRTMAPGWPARSDGASTAARLVLKQVRSLDPGLPNGVESLVGQPIPRELLAYAKQVERRSCVGRRARLELLELWTDPMAAPPLGYGEVPFLVRVQLRAQVLRGGALELAAIHSDFRRVVRPGMDRGGPWSLDLEFEAGVSAGVGPAGAGVGVDRIEYSGGRLRLFAGGEVLDEAPATCTSEMMFASPELFLRSLL